ncbi:MAG: hypothetical protein AB7F51_16900 [Pseudorhodoplanes sp.]
MSRARDWMRQAAARSAGASLFWLMTIAALAIAGMTAIALYAIHKGVTAAAASLLGTALPLLGYAARDVVGAMRAIMGAPAAEPANEEEAGR